MTTVNITNEAYRVVRSCGAQPAPALDRLVAARNDNAAFQVILQSDRQYSVNVGHVEWFSHRTRLRGPHERLRVAVSAPFAVELNPEGFMTDSDDIEKADMLLTQDVVESVADFSTAVWAEIKVPADAQPGEYTVSVAVYRSAYGEDEKVVMTAEIPLTVGSYVLPDPKDWHFYLNLWQHLSSIARHHDVRLWSDEHFEVIKEYIRTIAALGQKSITLCAGEIPWSGQSCASDRENGGNLFEYSIIGITKKADGTFVYDYEKMQRHIDFCTAQGMTGDIEIFGLVNVWQKLIPTPLCEGYPENIVLRYFDEADGCMKYIRSKDEVIDYVKSLEAYFIRTGQIGRVRIGADEPADIDRYRETLALLNEVAPSFKCATAINHAEFIEIFQDQIDTSAPYLRCVSEEYQRLMDHKAQFPHKKLLWYVCGGKGVVNNAIADPLVANRTVGPLTDRLGLDGFLRWNYCLYPFDPRKDIRYSAFYAGDVNFVYPSHNGKVLLSLRYKNLQRGIADYELIRALREKDGAAADEAVKGLFDFETPAQLWEKRGIFGQGEPLSRDWNVFNAMKAALLEQLN